MKEASLDHGCILVMPTTSTYSGNESQRLYKAEVTSNWERKGRKAKEVEHRDF